MAYDFLETLSTPSVKAAQVANGAGKLWAEFSGHREFTRFTEAEAAFIASRDSFYIATVAENGWPYVQHRGGPPGFLRMLDERTLAFADFRGNLQYISVGNLGANDRAAMILMDYPRRRRLKILGHVEIKELADDPALAGKLVLDGYKAKVERAVLIRLQAFDWNCPQHITPRFTEDELTDALAPVRERIAALEAENAELRAKLAGSQAATRARPRPE
jgi:predicted pyridoxine 5'-phosphate oxidase superfamily flavin-nucleotide-binding protein